MCFTSSDLFYNEVRSELVKCFALLLLQSCLYLWVFICCYWCPSYERRSWKVTAQWVCFCWSMWSQTAGEYPRYFDFWLLKASESKRWQPVKQQVSRSANHTSFQQVFKSVSVPTNQPVSERLRPDPPSGSWQQSLNSSVHICSIRGISTVPSKNTSGLKIKRRAAVCEQGRQDLEHCLLSKQAGGQKGSTALKDAMAEWMTESSQVCTHKVFTLRAAGSRPEGESL